MSFDVFNILKNRVLRQNAAFWRERASAASMDLDGNRTEVLEESIEWNDAAYMH